MRNRYFILILAVFLSCTTLSFAQKGQESKAYINVATFNLRMDTKSDGANQWSNRKELVKSLIRFHEFDIFGTQEGFKHMLVQIAELKQYAWIGEGRDGGDEGEHSAIFYRKDRFDLLDSGNFWYSETPEKVGLGWDVTCCNRICSWGKFREKISGKIFFLFNSHFDHQGVIARRESARLLLQKIKSIAGTNATVIITGDFNATPESEPIRILLNDGLLLDSYKISIQPPYGTYGTSNGWKIREKGKDQRIDHIFVTKDVSIQKYGVINDMPYGQFPSDHYPVMVKAGI